MKKMGKGTPSDGSNQAAFATFMSEFDSMVDQEIMSAIEYFAEKKENNRERFDDITLPLLSLAIYKFHERFGKVPPVVKQYCFIKLQQGKASWDPKIKTVKQDATRPWSRTS